MRRTTLLLLILTVVATSVASWLFPRAFPIVALENRIARASALERVDSFVTAHDLAPRDARRAIRFTVDDSLRTFIELGGGGKDTLDALLRAGEIAIFSWNVRLFVPGEVTESRVRLSHDGRPLGFRRNLPDSLPRPAMDSAGSRALAEQVINTWLDDSSSGWALLTASYATRAGSGRIDRTWTFERPFRAGGAPVRMDVTIAGDLVSEARTYVVIPESFARRYDEMRSANTLLALIATVGLIALIVAAMVALRRYARLREVRWRPAALVGTVIGCFATAAILNSLPGTWYDYDTATPAVVHQFAGVFAALAGGAGTALLVGLTLASAEALSRRAFPWHADWWQLWRFRGTREVGGQVLGGYAMAAAGFAYIATFYLVTRSWFGWWVPSELLDDPNQIATPLPWIAGIGLSLQAAVWEEALFRAIPLSLLSIWVAGRNDRERWMALGVVATALVFGFAHANYPSWPPYSRGVEIFLEACLWAVLFLRFGLLVPVLAHFAYDLVLFGLFATAGTAVAYRTTAGMMLLALLAPALVVLWARVRQGSWKPLPDDGLFGAWTRPAPPVPAGATAPVAVQQAPVHARSRGIAILCAVAALVFAVARPVPDVVGPQFTAPREAVLAAADSALRSRGQDPAAWRQLAWVPSDTLGRFRRLLRQHRAESLAVSLGGSYAIPRWWLVRYVKTDATVAERAEEWRVRVLPDGRALDVRHIVPEDAPGASPPPDSVRRLAGVALDDAGIPTSAVRETNYDEDLRGSRRDVTITYTDTATRLPGGADARVWIALAGDEVLSVRRGVELPESFVREERRRETTGFALAGALALAVLVFVIWGIVRLSRRPLLLHDAVPKRTVLVLLGVLVLATAIEAAQSYTTSLAQYDTSMPWDNFVSMILATQMLTVFAVLVFALLWLLANGMRRRAGIPLVARRPDGRPVPDELVLGAALGSIAMLVSTGADWLLADPVPGSPSTILTLAVPVLAMVPEAISRVATVVPIAAIPALSIVGVSGNARGRLLAAFIVGWLIVAISVAMDGPSASVSPLALAYRLGTIAAVIFAVREWGRLSVTTWIIAALFSGALSAARDAVHAATAVERLAAVLGLLLAGLLIALVRRWAATPGSVLGDPAGQAPGRANQDEVTESTQHVQ